MVNLAWATSDPEGMMVAGVRLQLYAAGTDVERELARGSLVLVSGQDHLDLRPAHRASRHLTVGSLMSLATSLYDRPMVTTNAIVSGHKPNSRASTRHAVAIDARIGVDGQLIPCVLTNVSQGGAFAAIGRLPMGTAVTLWFTLDETGDVIETDAVVRWAESHGVGLQFGALRARMAWALGQFLLARSR
ncbi:MAG TPA: PilZ domain-containing protein [Kofleriaceae bacterium]|nr:PilZ domain-containing protein [Kofleriaceae bacterium]